MLGGERGSETFEACKWPVNGGGLEGGKANVLASNKLCNDKREPLSFLWAFVCDGPQSLSCLQPLNELTGPGR